MIMFKVYFTDLCSVLLVLIPQFNWDPLGEKQLFRRFISVISYNIKGLHGPMKRRKIPRQLKRYGCQFAHLQESSVCIQQKVEQILGRQGVLLFISFRAKERGLPFCYKHLHFTLNTTQIHHDQWIHRQHTGLPL